jgi:hypothetical protein
MIHTQYYALMRALAAAIQRANPYTQITQWDFNYNSKTFNSLKLHRNPLPYPKGIINISSIQKQFMYPLQQNMYLGMNAANLLKFPNIFPIASVVDKFEIYGLSNRYNININVTLQFETGAQLLDFYHLYNEFFPGEGKYFYDFSYDYFLYLPSEIIEGFDPTTDEAINIYAEMKDDASNFQLFSKCVSEPLIKITGINIMQDSNTDSHQIEINFEIQDSFLYMLIKVDSKYWLRATSTRLYIKVADYGDQLTNADCSGTGEGILLDESNQDPLPDFKNDPSPVSENGETNNDTEIKDAT